MRSGPCIVLVVEDNPADQLVLRKLLERFDYDVRVVSSGEAALVELDGGDRISAVIMDVTLDGMDGLECARRIRMQEEHNSSRMPIIAVTARAERKDRKACLESGMDDFLTKPFDPEELRRILLRWTYRPDNPNLKLLRG
jgi:CheY-like chemotaxis protein